MKTVVVLLVVALALGASYWIYAQSRRSQAPTLDGMVIERLVKAKSDLSKAHDIDFFFFFPSREDAAAALKELQSSMDFSKADIADSGDKWGLQLTRSMQPIEAELVALRSSFGQLAARHGGEYDGWGTLVVPME